MEGTARVFAAVLRNRDLRRVELAFVGFNAAEYAVWIAMLLYAYGRGGATAASVADGGRCPDSARRRRRWPQPFDVAARSLLQRVTPADVLGRVFGVLEGVDMAALALGAVVVPPLVAFGDSTAALVAVGLSLPLVALVAIRSLRRIDRSVKVPVGEIALLTDVPRTATVTARSAVRAYSLEKDAFVTVVTGHAPVAQQADDVVPRRQAELAAL